MKVDPGFEGLLADVNDTGEIEMEWEIGTFPSETSGNPREIVAQPLDRAARKPLGKLRSDHVTEHQRLFRSVSLDLGTTQAFTENDHRAQDGGNRVEGDQHRDDAQQPTVDRDQVEGIGADVEDAGADDHERVRRTEAGCAPHPA